MSGAAVAEMTQAARAEPTAAGHDRPAEAVGIFPSQCLAALVEAGAVAAERGVAPEQIQPASIDLRLGAVAYRVRASFLPGGGSTVESKLREIGMHEVDLTRGAVLERGCVYIVPLQERLALPGDISGFANPKSSTGRLDVFTRVITDNGSRFDWVARGYHGPLYAEVSPRTFSIQVREGSKLTQLRLRRGRSPLTPAELIALHGEVPLTDAPLDPGEIEEHGGLNLSIDLSGGTTGIAGYRAKKHAGVVDIDRAGGHEPADFWEEIAPPRRGGIILNPDDFYILATREAVTVPPGHAAEMIPYDTLVGEFRVHYAGFFDPGFGYAPGGGAGSRGVLEVRSHDVPFLLEHGQLVGRLSYERLTDAPDRLYGAAIGSFYQGQGLALGKQFRR